MNSSSQFSRRSLFIGVGGVAAVAALYACSSDKKDSVSGGEPLKDGVLRTAIIGSPADTLNFAAAVSTMPFAIALNVLDSLVVMQDGKIVNQLAESLTPNPDCTEWTVKLREGVKFHDGSPLDADDVIYSLQFLTRLPGGRMGLDAIDIPKLTRISATELTIPLKESRGDFTEGALSMMSTVLKRGAFADGNMNSPKNLIGTGPYKLDSFNASTGTKLSANESYWDGAPKIKKLELVPFADDAAATSALLGGQVHHAMTISATGVRQIRADKRFTASSNPSSAVPLALAMNTGVEAFKDPEVRRALKLGINRQRLVDVALEGNGNIGNDLVGLGLPGYNSSLPQRKFEPDTAKRILAAKGIKELSMIALNFGPGLKDSVTLLKQQLGDLGIKVTSEELDVAAMSTPEGIKRLASAHLIAFFYANRPATVHYSVFANPNSPYNFSQWKDPEYIKLLDKAQIDRDKSKRTQALMDAQKLTWEEGGEIVWGYRNEVAGAAKQLKNVSNNQTLPVFAKATWT